jgi:hypothetical protein
MTWALRYEYESSFRLPVYTWDRDRKVCERCKHLRLKNMTSMLCALTSRGAENCITARESGGICGPDAALFEAA